MATKSPSLPSRYSSLSWLSLHLVGINKAALGHCFRVTNSKVEKETHSEFRLVVSPNSLLFMRPVLWRAIPQGLGKWLISICLLNLQQCNGPEAIFFPQSVLKTKLNTVISRLGNSWLQQAYISLHYFNTKSALQRLFSF